MLFMSSFTPPFIEPLCPPQVYYSSSSWLQFRQQRKEGGGGVGQEGQDSKEGKEE